MTSNNNNTQQQQQQQQQQQKPLKPILKGTKSNFTLVHNISNVTDERVKDYLKTEILVKEWIEQVLNIKIKENLQDALKNGIVLCYLANEIQENIVPMITEKSKLGLEFKNNIDFFLLALKDLGFPKQKLFNLNDLYEGENIVRVVECLSSLSKFACSQKGFSIPMKSMPSSSSSTTIKLPTSNEQLNKLKLQLSQIKDYTDKSNGSNQSRIGTNVLKARMALLAGNSIDFVKCERGFIKFQSLWRGFKVRQVVKKMKRDIAYREKVTQEILKTEEDYVKSLNCCIKGYMEPLIGKELINKDQQKLIFSDIQIIYNFGNKFLEELRKRCGKNWTVYQKLSDMFISISAFLKVYTSYVQNYNTALETLEELKKKDKFLNALNELKESQLINGHDITAFLIQPVQRVPRYYMLLIDLVKHTWEDHPDYIKLAGAAEKIKDVATFLNERKREGENFQKFTEIQSILVGKVPQLFTPSRRYIKQISFTTSQKSKKETMVYLFNDVIIYGKVIKGIFSSDTSSSSGNGNNLNSNDKVKYQGMIELISSIVYDPSDNGTITTSSTTTSTTSHSFELRTNDKDNLTLLTIYSKNQNEKNNLKNEIKKLISQIHENLRSKEQKLIESSALANGNGSGGSGEEETNEPTIEEQLQRNKTMKKVESSNNTTTTTTTITTTTTTSTTPPLTTPRESITSPSRNNSNNSFSPPNSPDHNNSQQQSIPVSSFISSLFSKKKQHQSNTITSPPLSPNSQVDSDSNSNSNSSTITSPPLSPTSPSTPTIDEAEINNKSSPKQSRKSKRQTLSSPSSSSTVTSSPTPSNNNNNNNNTNVTSPPSSPTPQSSNDETNSSSSNNSSNNSKINRPRSTSRFSKIAGVLTLRKRREKSQVIDGSQIPTSDDESSTTPTKSTNETSIDQDDNHQPSPLSASTPNPSNNNNNNNSPSNLTSSTNTTPTSTTTTTTTTSTINRLSSSSSVSTNSECDTTTTPSSSDNSNTTTTTTTTTTNYLSYEKILLLKNELDLMKLETYLSNEDFKKVFNIERSEFITYPKWKQTQIKRDLKLY